MKKDILRQIASVVLAILPTMLYAQLNPKQGYVITNQNDTIYGTIDYLSDSKCAYECHFKPDGETGYKTYQPNDIRAYRCAENGVFYVSKTFDVEGVQKTFFAEYLVLGGVSLFYHREADIDYYYFIGEDGKVAIVKNDGSYNKNLDSKSKAKKKRAALGEVSQIFTKSNKPLHDLWIKDINARQLTRITYDYNREYCTSAGDCVQFRRNENASRGIVAKFRLQAGIELGSNKLGGLITNYVAYNDITMKTAVPHLGIGVDLLFPRLNKHWSVQALALVSRWSMSDEYIVSIYNRSKEKVSLKYWDLNFQVGPVYSFSPESKISPVLRAGFAMETPFGIKKSNFGKLLFDNDLNPTIQSYGFYVGTGVDMAIQKHTLRLTLEYQWTHSPNNEVDFSHLGICAGIRL